MICHGGKFRTILSFSSSIDRFRWRVSNTNFCISEICYSYLVLNILLLTCLLVEVVAQTIVDFVLVSSDVSGKGVGCRVMLTCYCQSYELAI